ncbi:hypothetical protein ABT095_20850 [Kitasatospora sp. NPDC002227]|uniref:hypothetical protein n=1 Tax=Kitasatospora sp. NPDC002227 TaxID=3154773 RepID=UPI003318D53E
MAGWLAVVIASVDKVPLLSAKVIVSIRSMRAVMDELKRRGNAEVSGRGASVE